MSVVITVLSVTASNVALLRDGPPEVGEFRDDVDDMADVAWFIVVWPAYASPRLNGGGSYVTPNSVCVQYGHAAGSETN